MTRSHVKRPTSNTTPGTNISVSVPTGGVAAGNTVIVTFAMDPASGTVTCSDSANNSYSVDASVMNGTSGTGIGVRTVVCAARISTALVGSDVITVTHPSVAAKTMSINEFTGLMTLDQ